jgi:lysophospholipase L1-like esterase
MADLTTARRVSTGNQGLSCPCHRRTAVHRSIQWNVMQHARACAPLFCWVGLTPVEESRTPPMPWMPNRAYQHATVAVVDAAIKRTAAEASIPYSDLFKAWTADRAYRHLLLDDIHPNAAGHEQICGRIKDFLHSRGLVSCT